MEYRELGNTGERVSVIGLGGIVVRGLPQPEADRLVADALERGVNYVDVSPTYWDAEERLGPALDGRRDGVFLACKTIQRTREAVEKELENSLRTLRTDHADVYQLHGLDDPAELKMALGPGGALEAFLAAREAGKIRFIGITGHSVENLSEALRAFPFDTVVFPVNYAQFEMACRGQELLELARSKGVARLAIKAAAKGPWGEKERVYPNCWYRPLSEKHSLMLAMRYALSRDISAVLPPGDPGLFGMVLDAAEDLRPIDEAGLEELRGLSSGFTPLFGPRA